MTMSEGDLAVTELAFVRHSTIAPRPPPATMTGALGWVRQNLLSSPFNIVLTILIVWVVGLGHFGNRQISLHRRGVDRQ